MDKGRKMRVSCVQRAYQKTILPVKPSLAEKLCLKVQRLRFQPKRHNLVISNIIPTIFFSNPSLLLYKYSVSRIQGIRKVSPNTGKAGVTIYMSCHLSLPRTCFGLNIITGRQKPVLMYYNSVKIIFFLCLYNIKQYYICLNKRRNSLKHCHYKQIVGFKYIVIPSAGGLKGTQAISHLLPTIFISLNIIHLFILINTK